MSFSTRVMQPEDWKKLKHFQSAEFTQPDKMGFEFLLWLERLRELAGVPMTITSSYRSPEYNRQVGGAPDSAHTDVPCDACDIGERPRPEDPNWNLSRFKIVKAALALGCTRIGTYANGSLHLDRTETKRPGERMWRVVGSIQKEN